MGVQETVAVVEAVGPLTVEVGLGEGSPGPLRLWWVTQAVENNKQLNKAVPIPAKDKYRFIIFLHSSLKFLSIRENSNFPSVCYPVC